MIKGVAAFCSGCGAELRRGKQSGSRCDPCQRGGPDIARVLPPEFYGHPAVVAAVAGYDFGAFFRLVREYTGWSQQTLADVLGFDQRRISDLECGVRRLRDVRLVVRVAITLAIPPILLGFHDGATVRRGALSRARKVVDWMDRRVFVQHVAGITLGMAAASGLDTERLLALLPDAEPTGTRHIGLDDVAVIEQLTTTFARQDYAHGAGLFRKAAVAQLSTVLPLLGAQVSPEVRPRLMVATARLAMQAGWMSHEVKQDEAARRLWVIGLELARDADDPLGSDLTAYLLTDMAIQAVQLGRPDEALHLVRIGQSASVGRDPVSALTNCQLTRVQAHAQAALGDLPSCDHALGQAQEHFAVIERTNRPPWGAYLDDVGFAADQGWVRYTLASMQRDQRTAGQAVPLLRYAVDNLAPDFARVRATSLADLAGAHALAGDTDTAVTTGHQAVDAITAVHSPRAHDRLQVLNGVLEPMHRSSGVAELRDRIATTAA